MLCPVCRIALGRVVLLPAGLSATPCDKGHGQWITAAAFAAWQEKPKPPVRGTPPLSVALQTAQPQAARICPDCGRIMGKYKVGRGLGFAIDHCGGCGGVWLDAEEWDTLVANNLHQDLYRIFSSAWQKKIRDAELRATLEAAYRKRLGADAFQKAQEIRAWVQGHPEKRALLAFIGEDDPYNLQTH